MEVEVEVVLMLLEQLQLVLEDQEEVVKAVKEVHQ